jgi:hypothetical protein
VPAVESGGREHEIVRRRAAMVEPPWPMQDCVFGIDDKPI